MMADLAEGLVEQAPDALIFADRGGIIRVWNSAAEFIFGHAADEAIGQSLDIIIPERFRAAHWAGYDRALASGTTKYQRQAMPTRSVRKDGTTIYVELTFAIVKDDAGVVVGATAQARDITERWTREREQRARQHEPEQGVTTPAS